ncbi:MAG TPA: hypothetical protein PK272_04690 [Methanoregulaceae archaeon]|jgi:hypothetical protein|nr:hypothetical protein [Methanoregulaceae archaeon]HNL85703.1 hypothetical protein [Methanoregulaceae archaeon]
MGDEEETEVWELESGRLAQIRMGITPRKQRMIIIVNALFEDSDFFDA